MHAQMFAVVILDVESEAEGARKQCERQLSCSRLAYRAMPAWLHAGGSKQALEGPYAAN